MSCFLTLRRRVWVWSSLAVFVSACGITERLVEEQNGEGGTGVLGSSSGSGGGGRPAKGGTTGYGGKPDFNAPDPLFPRFKNGDVCPPGTTGVPSSVTGAGGESGAGTGGAGGGGDAGERRCSRSSCKSTLVAHIIEVGAVVADAGQVFVAELGKANGYVIESRIGTGTHLLTALESPATDLAVDNSWVYVQTATKLQKIARQGGALQTLASDQSPRGLAVDSDYLYFLSDKNGRREVRRISLATGAGEALAVLDSTPFAIALDDDNAYVLGKAELLQIPKCREGRRVLAVTSGLGGGSLAVDAGYAYWSDDDVVSRVSKDTATAQTVIQASPLEGEILVDGSFVYWGDGSNGVLRAPVNGGTPEVIADDATFPVVRAADEQNVYFVDVAMNEVRSVPK